jgi:hypothetical protein
LFIFASAVGVFGPSPSAPLPVLFEFPPLLVVFGFSDSVLRQTPISLSQLCSSFGSVRSAVRALARAALDHSSHAHSVLVALVSVAHPSTGQGHRIRPGLRFRWISSALIFVHRLFLFHLSVSSCSPPVSKRCRPFYCCSFWPPSVGAGQASDFLLRCCG